MVSTITSFLVSLPLSSSPPTIINNITRPNIQPHRHHRRRRHVNVKTQTRRPTSFPSHMCTSLPPPPQSKEDSNTTEACTYCQGELVVHCPVCEGRGYLGRTIRCYYCSGAKRIDCPLCIDDIYKLSYKPVDDKAFDDDDDDDDDVSNKVENKE